MITGRWSEFSAEHEVRYNENERLLVLTMSRTSGLTEGFYGLVVGETGPKIYNYNSTTTHTLISNLFLIMSLQCDKYLTLYVQFSSS